ncbi:tetratricopeptide repeat protein [Kitasatospora aureofaciens]|uniref:SEL1-like repeat protein n=1 Tax=Kitasatospora aureofaciens TaxID=1894 RepID=UPI001D8EE76A|nr:tetratricopeptide repeat protein [Kitasatospora aureofaciens]HJD80215.1 tetratricopeptide repeat protein [Kitasatospora aureofaciens]
MGMFGRKKKQPAGLDIGGGTRLHIEASPQEIKRMVKDLRGRAEAGDVEAMADLGRMLEYQGKVEEAMRWHQQAAVAGDVDSAAWLADRLLKNGQITTGLDYLRLAARGGHLSATFNLGAILLSQDENSEEGARWMLRAAEAGHQKAIDHLGIDMAQVRAAREEVARDVAKAEQGDAEAAHRAAAVLLDLGEAEQAEHLLELAANGGIADAAWELALRVHDRGDTPRAVELLEQAGRNGRPGGAKLAGIWLYTEGEPAAAVPLLRRAVAEGEELLTPVLGAALSAAGDLDGAEAVLRPAAEAGDWQAQYNLLAVLQQRAARTGGDRSTEEMWSLLSRATVGLHAQAQERLDAGEPQRAADLLLIGARAGDPAAQRSLGELLLAIDPKDPEGQEWLRRSGARR